PSAARSTGQSGPYCTQRTAGSQSCFTSSAVDAAMSQRAEAPAVAVVPVATSNASSTHTRNLTRVMEVLSSDVRGCFDRVRDRPLETPEHEGPGFGGREVV